MNIIKTDAGFAIKFPFALKDNFRAAFPSAKWDSFNKQWTVGSKSLKRLEAWVAAMSEAAVAVAVVDEIEFNEKEIARLKEEAARFIKEAAAANDLAQKARQAKELMLAAAQELADAKAAKEAAEKAQKSERDEVVAILESIIDLNSVREAMRVMAANHVPSIVVRKEAFEQARMVVKAQRDVLAAAGWSCEAISKAARANVNRPDRDAIPMIISKADWFNINAI